MRVRHGDTGVCVGDFINYGNARGVPGEKIKPQVYLDQLIGNWVMIEGNHDKRNHLKTVGKYMFCRISHFNVFVTHYPTTSNSIPDQLKLALPGIIDFVICGHVHDKWREFYDERLMLWNINVGLDVWKYNPVSDDELAAHYIKIIKHRIKDEKKNEEKTPELSNVQTPQDEKSGEMDEEG